VVLFCCWPQAGSSLAALGENQQPHLSLPPLVCVPTFAPKNGEAKIKHVHSVIFLGFLPVQETSQRHGGMEWLWRNLGCLYSFFLSRVGERKSLVSFLISASVTLLIRTCSSQQGLWPTLLRNRWINSHSLPGSVSFPSSRDKIFPFSVQNKSKSTIWQCC
jgi:hypothetical protein